MSKISVIIPCYNVELWIDRCVQSIVNQTFGIEDLQVILVDDCSTDGTLQKLSAWQEKYPDQMVVVASPQNGRQGKARNIGLAYAEADWIAFLDSDDWIEPTYFEKLYSIGMTDDYDIVDCRSKRDFSKELSVFDDVKTGKENHIYSIQTVEERKPCIVTPPWSLCAYGKIIKKDFLVGNAIYFPEHLAYEDGYWGSILTMCVQKVYVLEEYLYHYFVNDESTVLKGGEHHWDFVTVQTILWDEWGARGYLETYQDELEMEHIFSAYLQGLKTAIWRYEVPNYNYYRLLRELILQRIPDYTTNPYIQRGILKEVYKLMMVALVNELSKTEFLQFAESLKKIGI